MFRLLPRPALPLLAVAAAWLPTTASTAQDSPQAGLPTGCQHLGGGQVRQGPTSGKRVALTFDDGPGALTNQFLKILERENVHATFFVVGEHIAGREATLRRILADGSMIGNHSFDHVSLAKADKAARRQINESQAAIKDATGFTPCLLRPPYGLSSKALVSLLDRDKLTSTLWSVDPADYTNPGSKTITQRVLAGTRPGSIVLSHDGGPRRETLNSLSATIKGLRAHGYTFVTVPELLGLGVSR